VKTANATNALGEMPMARLVLKLAGPAMIAQLVSVLYNIVDRMYIGNIPQIGNIALAGVGVCGPIVTLLNSFGPLVGLGGSILLAMHLGEKSEEKAKKVLSNSFLMLISLSIALTIAFLLMKERMLYWFGASDVTFPYADTYLTIYTFGAFFALLGLGLNYFITCQGFSGVGMATILTGSVANIILDPIFIFGFDMGVAGAAVATVLSHIISCTLILLFLFGKKVTTKITFGGYDLQTMGRILKIGFPPFLILASDSVLLIVMNAMLQRYGGALQGDLMITCATISQSYLMLITYPLGGITAGTQGIIAYNYGARNIARVRSAFKHILGLAILFTSTMFVISQVIPQHFVRLYTDLPDYTELSVWAIRVTTLAAVPLSFQYTAVDGLTGMGATKIALCMSAFRKTLYVILTVCLPLAFDAKSVFYAEALAAAASSIFATTLFFLTFNRIIRSGRKL